ncbi:bifunctional oligoribonuclease/PAP phosphatase NrnA [bacterium]|nr:bifunctional oligoribonuclease/PAP phosphatase NrnA [bacterium]
MQNTIKHTLEDLKEYSDKIVITTHHKPDGDAMGSSLALYNYFKAAGIKSKVITPTDYADFLWWMPGHEDVLVYEGNEEDAEKIMKEAKLLYCLDFNALGRINDMGRFLETCDLRIILIDHHRDPQDFDDERLCSINASSTCELIHQYFTAHLDPQFINQEAAQCIYTGLITDTGSFRYDSTSSTTIRVAADLLDRGAVPSVIYDKIFDQNRLERLKLMGFFLQNKIELIEEGKVALATLTTDELQKFNVKTGDTEGFVNFGLSIAGVKMSALIIDRSVLVKMSFRSKGEFPCNTFAAENFNGGGHFNAAGGASNLSLEDTVEKFKTALKDYSKYLE